jgi:segregation and condensation protein B
MLDFRFVDGTRLTSVIEALIFSSSEPISWRKLADIVQQSEDTVALDERTVDTIVEQLNTRYEENDLAFRIERSGGGYTFRTTSRFYTWLSIYQHENAYRRLSQPAIETLAIVAYRQPITKPEVDQIRGVDSGYILRQLLEKMLVRVSGRAKAPGKPLLYKTTDTFLKHFGLYSLDDLPKPREIDEILKDDDMADHRRLLMERQLEMGDGEEEGAGAGDVDVDVDVDVDGVVDVDDSEGDGVGDVGSYSDGEGSDDTGDNGEAGKGKQE